MSPLVPNVEATPDGGVFIVMTGSKSRERARAFAFEILAITDPPEPSPWDDYIDLVRLVTSRRLDPTRERAPSPAERDAYATSRRNVPEGSRRVYLGERVEPIYAEGHKTWGRASDGKVYVYESDQLR